MTVPFAEAGTEPGAEAGALGRLSTEEVRPELAGLDLLGTLDLVALISADSRRAGDALVAAVPALAAAVEVVCRQLGAGGRLIYVGAGSAGRLAVLDAAELGPTFNVRPGSVEAVMAGGDRALRHPAEGAEDDAAAGAAAVAGLAVGPADVVIGVSASGRTPYVLGAIEHSRACGAATIGLSCNAGSALSTAAELPIELVVGGEVIAGSSRLNAGTAQKVALNTISTAAMVRMGKTYGNLMVDVRATNTKLQDRAVCIVAAVTGAGAPEAHEALVGVGWDAKLACLMAASGRDMASVVPILDAAGGRLRTALALVGAPPAAGAAALPASPPTSTPAPGRSWKRLGVGAAFVDGVLVPGDVAVDGGVVVAVGLPGRGPTIAIPGLVDLQVNGYAGVDAAGAEVEDSEALGAALAADGVLAYQPTLITGDPEVTVAALARIAQVLRLPPGPRARILGAHVEGPFLSPQRPGTHPVSRLMAPDARLVGRFLDAGPVSMLTLAPELPGALELIAELCRRGVVVSLGHSAATAAQAAAAIGAGASSVTHLFNAMPPVASRTPGIAGLALSDRRVKLQLIADGEHVADELVRLAFAAGSGRCSIVTDATSLAGRAPGGGGQEDNHPVLGEVPVTLSGGVARRPDGTIAGGASTLLDGLRHLQALSIALGSALGAVTEAPARVLGRGDIGHLRPGGPANMVVLDDRLELRDVFVAGQPLGPG